MEGSSHTGVVEAVEFHYVHILMSSCLWKAWKHQADQQDTRSGRLDAVEDLPGHKIY